MRALARFLKSEGWLAEMLAATAVAVSGKEDFYLLRVPICFCLAYPFCQCAIAASKVAKASGNHHQDFPG